MMTKISYSGYRFPPEIIQQAIWLYVRFTLSSRDVEDLLAERGIVASYETVRRWVNHFGPKIAANLRKRRPKPHTNWHLDEVYLKIDCRTVYAKAHRHQENVDKTIWEVFEDERPKLVRYHGRFDGFHALPASVSKTCLVRFDNNKYSVSASAVGRPVEIHAYADRIVIRQDGRIVAEHPRCYGRGETIYDPWHYVPVLARKPGALRNGAPFKDWVLPAALDRIRRKLAGSSDGDRQMVKILAAVLTDGLSAVEAACLQALSEGVHSADVVINILARQRDPGPAATIMTPDALRLLHAPIADCARYDQLRSV